MSICIQCTNKLPAKYQFKKCIECMMGIKNNPDLMHPQDWWKWYKEQLNHTSYDGLIFTLEQLEQMRTMVNEELKQNPHKYPNFKRN